MRYQVAWNAATNVATVQTKGAALPAGSINAGEFVHGPPVPPHDKEGDSKSHVLYQHVQELLYFKNKYDMQTVRINFTDDYTALTGVALTPKPSIMLTVNNTRQLATNFTPSGASNKSVTYTTSDATKATVSATGLITAKAPGSAIITVTTEDGGKTDSTTVTVTAN